MASDQTPLRKLGPIDAVLIIVLGGLAWTAVQRTYADATPVRLALAAPVCVTFGFLGVWIHSRLRRKSLSLLVMSRWTYTIAWIAALARLVILTRGLGTLAADSAGENIVNGFGFCSALVAPIAAFVAYLECQKFDRARSAIPVLFFGLYPLVSVVFDALQYFRGTYSR